MSEILFVFFCGAIIWIQYQKEKNMINLISLLAAPYMILVPLNNFFMVRNGFYKIGDSVLLMVGSSITVFFLGTLFITPKKLPKLSESDNDIRYDKYNIKNMSSFILFVDFFCLLKFLRLYKDGMFSGANIDSAEGIMGTGTAGHLMLSCYCVLPIVFMYWLDHKKEIRNLIAVILFALVSFSTFVKYNIISIFVCIFIFVCIYKKSLLKRMFFSLGVFTIAVFVLNYFITFTAKQIKVGAVFYTNHFWTYASGSLIYDNYIFDPGFNTDLSFGYRILSLIFAFPNMFIQKVTGGGYAFPAASGGNRIIGSNGATSNVTDAFGFLFPSKASVEEYLFYYIFIFMLGLVFARLYEKAKLRAEYFDTFIVNLLVFFVFFSFFGSFYIHAAPWEILIDSFILPSVFLKKSQILEGKLVFIK